MSGLRRERRDLAAGGAHDAQSAQATPGDNGTGIQPAAAVARTAVVVPCYAVGDHILDVLRAIPPYVSDIYCVDDACPDGSADLIAANINDERVHIIRHKRNCGVGGAMVTGYRAAIANGADIVVKLDGDGQMDPRLIDLFVAPILAGEADYTKGNRFYRPESLSGMPFVRLYGNAILSLLSKLSSGYWQIFDPNNGFTAVHARVLEMISLDKLASGYFFEADMLFRLSTVRAVVVDIPMDAVYGEERSNLRVPFEVLPMLGGHTRNFFKRLLYAYFLRDFSVASIEWVLGPALLAFGVVFGTIEWSQSAMSGEFATPGIVMIAALPIIIGLQMLLSAINFDVQSVPKRAIHPILVRISRIARETRFPQEGRTGTPT